MVTFLCSFLLTAVVVSAVTSAPQACRCVQQHLCPATTHSRLNSTSHGCPEDEVCCADLQPRKKAKMISSLPRRPRKRAMCGQKGITSRVLRGETDTEPREFPWMLAIFRNEDGGWKFQCGASIIGKNVALTAAHCVDDFEDNPEALEVRADIWDLEDKSFQQLKVDKVVLHPEYSSDPPRNDIAVIVTKKNFRPGMGVSSVCIPPKGFEFPPGTRCVATGWGRDHNDPNSSLDAELKKVEVPLVSREVCQRRLRRTYLGKFYLLHKSFTCAGGDDLDTCQGDGGGPLLCSHNERYFQAGIVSWGIGCGVRKLPAVYTDITFFRDWIKEMHDLHL